MGYTSTNTLKGFTAISSFPSFVFRRPLFGFIVKIEDARSPMVHDGAMQRLIGLQLTASNYIQLVTCHPRQSMTFAVFRKIGGRFRSVCIVASFANLHRAQRISRPQ